MWHSDFEGIPLEHPRARTESSFRTRLMYFFSTRSPIRGIFGGRGECIKIQIVRPRGFELPRAISMVSILHFSFRNFSVSPLFQGRASQVRSLAILRLPTYDVERRRSGGTTSRCR